MTILSFTKMILQLAKKFPATYWNMHEIYNLCEDGHADICRKIEILEKWKLMKQIENHFIFLDQSHLSEEQCKTNVANEIWPAFLTYDFIHGCLDMMLPKCTCTRTFQYSLLPKFKIKINVDEPELASLNSNETVRQMSASKNTGT